MNRYGPVCLDVKTSHGTGCNKQGILVFELKSLKLYSLAGKQVNIQIKIDFSHFLCSDITLAIHWISWFLYFMKV